MTVVMFIDLCYLFMMEHISINFITLIFCYQRQQLCRILAAAHAREMQQLLF